MGSGHATWRNRYRRCKVWAIDLCLMQMGRKPEGNPGFKAILITAGGETIGCVTIGSWLAVGCVIKEEPLRWRVRFCVRACLSCVQTHGSPLLCVAGRTGSDCDSVRSVGSLKAEMGSVAKGTPSAGEQRVTSCGEEEPPEEP